MSATKNAHLPVGVLFLIILLCGCATPQTQKIFQAIPENLPAQIELTDVPFYPQETYQCGPAALATALNFSGARITPSDLIAQVYLPAREGSLQVEMLAATRRNGFLAYEIAPKLEDLLVEVAAGTPVVVLQNLGLSWLPKWHYAVVVGYDLPRREIILRSGLTQRQVLPFTTFEHTWARSAHWAMLVLPAGSVPRTATEAGYIKAALALEKNVTSEEVVDVYQAALKKWPENLTAHIGLGNAFYAQNDKALAENIFRQATLKHPDSAIAFNNLAQTLFDDRRYVEAHSAATQAVSLAQANGGEALSSAQQTLKQINEKILRADLCQSTLSGTVSISRKGRMRANKRGQSISKSRGTPGKTSDNAGCAE